MNRSWIAVLVAMPGTAQCLDLTVEAGYGASYTNNAQEAPDHGTGQWTQQPQLNLLADQRGTDTTFTADYNATRNIYQRNIYGDETIVAGISTVTWDAIANRLTLDASNTRTQTTIDARGQNVPTNQQVIDTTSAGGTLTMNAFSDHRLNVGYHYSFDNADTTNTDSRRQTGNFAYVIPFDPRTQIQFNATIGKVDYDSSTATNYTSREGDFQYVRRGDRVDFDASLGYTVFDQEGHVDSVHGTTGYLDLGWHATPISTITVSYSRALGDGALDSTAGIPQFGQTFTDNSGLTQPYTTQTARLGLDTQLGHNMLTLTTYYSDQSYQDISGQNEDTVGGTIRAVRRLWPTLSATLFVDYSKTDFSGQSRTDHDTDTGLRLTWTRWRNLSFYATTTYTRRNSDDPTVEYTEWVGAFTLMYTLVGARSADIRGRPGGRGMGQGGMSGSYAR